MWTPPSLREFLERESKAFRQKKEKSREREKDGGVVVERKLKAPKAENVTSSPTVTQKAPVSLAPYKPPPLTFEWVDRLTTHLSALHLSLHGIFRVEVKASRRREISRRIFDSNDPIDLSAFSGHELSGILKMYLRDQDQAIVPDSLYPFFTDFKCADIIEKARKVVTPNVEDVSLCPQEDGEGVEKRKKIEGFDDSEIGEGEPSDETDTKSESNAVIPPQHSTGNSLGNIVGLIGLLPDENQKILLRLMRFLNDVDSKSEENQMTANNLGTLPPPSLSLSPLSRSLPFFLISSIDFVRSFSHTFSQRECLLLGSFVAPKVLSSRLRRCPFN